MGSTARLQILSLALIILSAAALALFGLEFLGLAGFLTGTAIVACSIALTLAVGRFFDRLTGELREKAAALEFEAEQHRHAQLALDQYAERERQLVAAVASTIHPVITCSLDGTITAWNPAASNASRSSAIATRLRPPTLIPRSSATYRVMPMASEGIPSPTQIQVEAQAKK